MSAISRASGSGNWRFANVINSINQKYGQNAKTALIKNGLKVIAKEQEILREREKAKKNVLYKTAPKRPTLSGYLNGFDRAFSDVVFDANCMRAENAGYISEIKNQLALSKDERFSEKTQGYHRQVAGALKEIYMGYLDKMQSRIKDASKGRKKTEQYEMLKEYASVADELSGLREKSLDEIFEAVEQVADNMDRFADRLQEAHFKKHGKRINRSDVPALVPQPESTAQRDATRLIANLEAVSSDGKLETIPGWEIYFDTEKYPREYILHVDTRA